MKHDRDQASLPPECLKKMEHLVHENATLCASNADMRKQLAMPKTEAPAEPCQPAYPDHVGVRIAVLSDRLMALRQEVERALQAGPTVVDEASERMPVQETESKGAAVAAAVTPSLDEHKADFRLRDVHAAPMRVLRQIFDEAHPTLYHTMCQLMLRETEGFLIGKGPESHPHLMSKIHQAHETGHENAGSKPMMPGPGPCGGLAMLVRAHASTMHRSDVHVTWSTLEGALHQSIGGTHGFGMGHRTMHSAIVNRIGT